MRGFISAKIEGKEELVNGIPQFTEDTWGELISCKYNVNEWDNKRAYNGGEATKYAFEITTTNMDFKADIIQLFDDSKELIGEFKVIALHKLKAVGRIKIKV